MTWRLAERLALVPELGLGVGLVLGPGFPRALGLGLGLQ